ncbi:multidrug effflux MFS transporter [Legionella londiniensis]|uniref:Bcr/CflA family efflux transporter n=1 Tax=Legionella londiniensis TaxID=45068 RepID=A0A0W0VRW4_9GAMM|nr:multidrug effflux MFS transporter [Legionella londiniensis]KTD22850.1 multidrug resistance protein [Legionella londiniensis]STX92713.1 multidrug resistance protein [Legionella londiniensis]
MNNIKVPLWIIVLIVALPQLSETIYTPALPTLAQGLHIDDRLAQYTLTTYLMGFAFGVLLWGRLSDRIGRKPGLLCGLSVYIVASFACYLSTSIEILLAMRFLQAFGASVGSVLGQAIARDAITPEDRGRAFSIISIAMAFAPALGPVIGGIITQYTEWSSVFLALCVLAGLIIIQILLFLPETHTQLGVAPAKGSLFWSCLTQMIRDPRLLGFGVMVGGVNGILFGYFAESPFFFIDSLGLNSSTFGMLAFGICLPLALGGTISKQLHARGYRADTIIWYGVSTIILGALSFYVLTATSVISASTPLISIPISLACICIVMNGVTMIIPNCLSQALQDYGSYAGTAASIFGFYYYLLISLFTGLMALLHDGSLKALPLFILIISGIMMSVYYIVIMPKSVAKEAV